MTGSPDCRLAAPGSLPGLRRPAAGEHPLYDWDRGLRPARDRQAEAGQGAGVVQHGGAQVVDPDRGQAVVAGQAAELVGTPQGTVIVACTTRVGVGHVDEADGGRILEEHAQRVPALNEVPGSRALWRLYVLDSYYGSLGHAGSRAWDLVEGRYALCVLFEYAATVGLIDVAYTDPRGARDDYRALWGADQLSCLSRYDGLAAVRVNELGAAVLHDPDALPGLGLPVPRRG